MKKFILAGALAMSAVTFAPPPAHACVVDAVTTCNSDFGTANYYLVAIRGWCYIIRWGSCGFQS